MLILKLRDDLQSLIKYALFFKRYIFTKVFDPTLLGATQGKENAYLATFDHTLTVYAQFKGCSKEEAVTVAIEEFSQLENPEVQGKIMEQLSKQREAADSSEAEWQESGDKEKYPHLYMVEKLNEIMWQQMGMPKELLCKLLPSLMILCRHPREGGR